MRKNKKSMKLAKKVAKTFHSSRYDPLGSYTGNPEDNEKPVQDADDL